MILQHKAYKFRIYPTEKQKILLERMFGCCRFVWNYYLNKEKEHYFNVKTLKKQEKCYIPYIENARELTQLKKEEEKKFLNETACNSLQSSLRHLDSAFKKFFNKQCKFPKYKKKYGKQNLTVAQGLKIKNKTLFIPKFREGIKIAISRIPLGKFKTSCLSKTSSGKYFISITLEHKIEKLSKNENKVGIDLGIKSFAFLSNNQEIKIPNTKILESKLKKAQKHLSKKQKGSNRRQKQKIKVARIYEKIVNIRRDFLQKTSTKLINENQVICLESLNINGMMKNHKLAKSIQNCSWAEFIRMLKYKASWYGRELIFIDRFFPSSKMCSNCSLINESLTLKTREWVCKDCGTVHQRDWNASKNILKQGLNLLSLKDSSFRMNDYKHREEISPLKKRQKLR